MCKEISKEVYRIVHIESNEVQSAYDKKLNKQYDFDSVELARKSNSIYEDKFKYKIAKYVITETLADDNCDKPTDEEINKYNIDKEKDRLRDLKWKNDLDRISIKIYKDSHENLSEDDSWDVVNELMQERCRELIGE